MATFTDSNTLPAAITPPAIYYLLWRARTNHPWQSEELFNRFDAHDRYFDLIARGFEAYLEKRQRALLPA